MGFVGNQTRVRQSSEVPPPSLRRRKRLRWRGFDYRSSGAYFVTLVTFRRERLLSRVVRGQVMLTPAGRLVLGCWREIPQHCPGVALDWFVIMPDHVHGILVLADPVLTLGQVVNLFKGAATTAIRAAGDRIGSVWQRGFHDRVIRDVAEWHSIRRYIRDNPQRWPN